MPGEFDLIKQYLLGRSGTDNRRNDGYPAASIPGSGVLLGAGDDAALIMPSPDKCVAISVDTSIVNVHFPSDASAQMIGHRALAVSLSDLAAMGARPRWCLMSLTLPQVDESWLSDFSDGFHQLARRYGINLVGGDVTRGELAISVTVLGENDPADKLRRDTAMDDQLIIVTGQLGNAAGGLRQWQSGQHDVNNDPLLKAYLLPEPKVTEGQALIGMASAAMDISDGLVADLTHLCEASNVGASLDLTSLPISSELRALVGDEKAVHMALHGGDDYELLFTLSESKLEYVTHLMAERGCPITVIGRTTKSSGIKTKDGKTHSSEGWNHFDASGSAA